MYQRSLNIIERVFRRAFSDRSIFLLLVIFAIVFLTSCFNRFIQIDENWFGEQAYYLASDEVVKLKTMSGVNDFDRQIFIYHKLLVLLGAIIVKIFGWSVYNFKLLTFSFYILFLWVYITFFKSNKQIFTNQQMLISILLTALTPVMIVQTFTFRPEIFVMTFGFISYYFLVHFLQKSELKHAMMAGFFAGLAFFTTLNGFLFIFSGAVLLFVNKKMKAVLIFLLFSFLSSLGFFWDLWQPGHWSLFLEQVRSGAESKLGEGFLSRDLIDILVSKISNLTSEHQRFFWSERVQAFSLLFWIAFAFNFKTLWSKYKDLIIYLMSLIVSLSIFSSHSAERYLIYYLPFMAIIISIGITNPKISGRRYLYFLYSLVFVINLISVVWQFHKVFSLNQNPEKIHKELLNKIPDKTYKVLAPWRFIYNEIGNYDLMSYQAMQYYQDNHKQKFTRDECIKILKNEFKVKYIILENAITEQPEHDYDWFKGMREQRDKNLALLYQDNNYMIFSIQ